MNATKIEWVKNPDGTQGYTWNPITGCNNQIDGMCKGGGFPCYAYRLANGRLRERYLANKNTATQNYDEDSYPFYPRFWEDRIRQLDPTTSKPLPSRGIFVCDMSDLFGIGIPQDWTDEIMWVIGENPQHRLYLLTKQPQNLIPFIPFPDNCWVGVTATDTGMAYKAVNNLKRIEAKVKYISFEPLLGRIINWVGDAEYLFKDLDWVIIGAQTNPYKPPKWEWVSEIIDACVKAGIPYFLKNNLEPIVPKVFGGDGSLIQELPNV